MCMEFSETKQVILKHKTKGGAGGIVACEDVPSKSD